MRKYIKLFEELASGDQQQIKLPVRSTAAASSSTTGVAKVDSPTTLVCVPGAVRPFVNHVLSYKPSLMKRLGVDETMLIRLAKAAIGIMGRETDFGQNSEISDDAAEFVRGIGLGDLAPSNQSLGVSQFTEATWNRYGLNTKVGPYNESLGLVPQGVATMFRILTDYQKAKANGIPTNIASDNPILKKYGVIKAINGTGDAAFDRAIIAHNFKEEQSLVNYCSTNSPIFAAPCTKATYAPFDKESTWQSFKQKGLAKAAIAANPGLDKFPGVLKVNQGAVIPGYFPNLSGGSHTALGYLEEVAGTMKKLNCF
jgi:hypothetical protein